MNSGNSKNKATELNGSTVLMVSNISRNVTKKHLQEIFSPYGELKGVYVPRHEETKLQKSYVFLEYGNQDNAEKAMLYFSGGQIDGLIVKVEILNPDNFINNTVNNSLSGETNLKNKTKEEISQIYHNRNYNPTSFKEREKEKDNLNNNTNMENQIQEVSKNLEDSNSENLENAEGKKLQVENLNKSNVKRLRSRSRSRKRSRSNSNPRYRRDGYKYTHNYNNNGYGGSRRYHDFNDRNRRRYKRKESRSSERSSERSSSRSSRSSS